MSKMILGAMILGLLAGCSGNSDDKKTTSSTTTEQSTTIATNDTTEAGNDSVSTTTVIDAGNDNDSISTTTVSDGSSCSTQQIFTEINSNISAGYAFGCGNITLRNVFLYTSVLQGNNTGYPFFDPQVIQYLTSDDICGITNADFSYLSVGKINQMKIIISKTFVNTPISIGIVYAPTITDASKPKNFRGGGLQPATINSNEQYEVDFSQASLLGSDTAYYFFGFYVTNNGADADLPGYAAFNVFFDICN